MDRLPRVLVGVLIVAALLVAADRGAAFLLAGSVARGLTSAQRLERPATVDFRGLPFLTQVVAGSYRDVEVGLTGIPVAGSLVVDRLDARLHGVRAPLMASVRGELRQLSVEQGEAEGFVSFASMEKAANDALGGRGVTVTLARAAEDRVAFTARISSILGTVTVRGHTRVAVQQGAVVLRLVPETLVGVPPEFRAQIVPQLDLSRLVPSLPFGFRATDVVVDPSGLRLHAAGTGLIIPV